MAEKLVEITERGAEHLTLAGEEMLAALAKVGVTLTDEQRRIAVQAYAASIRGLEGRPIDRELSQLAA